MKKQDVILRNDINFSFLRRKTGSIPGQIGVSSLASFLLCYSSTRKSEAAGGRRRGGKEGMARFDKKLFIAVLLSMVLPPHGISPD
ncbi:hypothetical protein ACAF76_004355 [Brevibacillus sp. TJ4]|uniref:hypothetical protein n=1 Tax=Brevibacillus sp. TJ4 TaxID=3234853 RepID=UPI0037D81DEE